MIHLGFPPGFVWGAATAAYQIEGAVHAAGRGESIWDRFSHTPGNVRNGDTGDVACDHYHRWAEDIALMQQIGLQAYRFSIAWPRILPHGDGAVNAAGLDFYDRLVDGLLAAGIAPFATLYHWDLPQALQDRQGGWASPAIVEQFAHYADVVSRRLGDRVKAWATINEPKIVALMGHLRGEHAPGLRDAAITARVVHHLLLAHGAAVPILRANTRAEAQVGIVLALVPVVVEGDQPGRWAIEDALNNRLFAEPIFKGTYPAPLIESQVLPGLHNDPQALAIISRPIDFLGVNYYSRMIVADPQAPSARRNELERTSMGWEVYPQGLYDTLMRMHRDYRPPALYITENGAAYHDTLSADGRIDDALRIAYLRKHLAMAHKAIADGAPLRGYFVWSLLDNFEWAHGYSQRFGIIYVDYTTSTRTLKESAHFYREVIAANGLDV